MWSTTATVTKLLLGSLNSLQILLVGSVFAFIFLIDVNMEEVTQAHYCIIEGEIDCKERKPLSIQFVRVPYNINEEIELARTNGSPQLEGYILELTKGKYRGKKKLYIGKVKKDSFIDNQGLDGIKIEKEDNSSYTIKVPEDTIKELVQNLKSEKYYMYFWNDKSIMIIYKDKIFEMDIDDKEKIKEAVSYGIMLGIPKEVLNFEME